SSDLAQFAGWTGHLQRFVVPGPARALFGNWQAGYLSKYRDWPAAIPEQSVHVRDRHGPGDAAAARMHSDLAQASPEIVAAGQIASAPVPHLAGFARGERLPVDGPGETCGKNCSVDAGRKDFSATFAAQAADQFSFRGNGLDHGRVG